MEFERARMVQYMKTGRDGEEDTMKKKKSRQLYFKLFCTYIAIAFFIVLSLTVYFISALVRDTLRSRQESAQQAVREAAALIRTDKEAADSMFEELYRDEQELRDVTAFLNLEPDEYQEYTLDEYSESNSLQYRGMDLFITRAFEVYPDLESIELLSFGRQEMTTFLPENEVYSYKDGTVRIRQIQEEGYVEPGKLQFVRTVLNPDTMKQEGAFVFTFPCSEKMEKIVSGMDYMELAIIRNDESLVCMSGEVEGWKELTDSGGKAWQIPGCDVYNEQEDRYQACSILDRKAASMIPVSALLAVLGVGIAIFGCGVFCINIYIRHLTDRVDVILSGMDQVTTGNLQVSLNVRENGDELDMIAGNFNEMCRKLDDHIQKSYLAEIEKKNAQLQALQSQINPHFLYNTLEAIRMKAICNGDRDVGKMLYSMSVLFRSQLKDADMIPIGQELDYCKQYLELFEYRYNGIFSYKIDCPVDLMGVRVIKFILQPIIENYFVHGIRRQDQDNRILLKVSKEGNAVVFQVDDNGMGMGDDLMKQKNRELDQNDYRQTKSVGIENVNRRVKAVYGSGYGITLAHTEGGGLSVIIRAGMEKGEL